MRLPSRASPRIQAADQHGDEGRCPAPATGRVYAGHPSTTRALAIPARKVATISTMPAVRSRRSDPICWTGSGAGCHSSRTTVPRPCGPGPIRALAADGVHPLADRAGHAEPIARSAPAPTPSSATNTWTPPRSWRASDGRMVDARVLGHVGQRLDAGARQGARGPAAGPTARARAAGVPGSRRRIDQRRPPRPGRGAGRAASSRRSTSGRSASVGLRAPGRTSWSWSERQRAATTSRSRWSPWAADGLQRVQGGVVQRTLHLGRDLGRGADRLLPDQRPRRDASRERCSALRGAAQRPQGQRDGEAGGDQDRDRGHRTRRGRCAGADRPPGR